MADESVTGGQTGAESSFQRSDLYHLRAAEGWLELGNPQEAQAELERITPELRGRPPVLVLSWKVYAAAKKWEVCVELATALTQLLPQEEQGWINLGNSLYFSGRTQAAYDCVKPILDRFPACPALRYNLACYSCQLGKLEEAKAWLAKAFELDSEQRLRLAAREDPDLAPLWEFLSG